MTRRAGTDLSYAGAQVAPDEELEALELCLDDDEGEVGLWVHVSGHVLDLFDLALYAVVDALEEAVARPSGVLGVSFVLGVPIAPEGGRSGVD